MSSKITLADILNGFSTTKLNLNFATIASAFDNTLSRDGSAPNAMLANLDLNSHRIINLTDPTNAQDAATKNYVDNNAGSGSGSGGDMFKADNLSGLVSVAASRTNLGLGTLAVLSNVSTKLAQGTNITLSTTGDVTTISASGGGGGDMFKSDNLSGLSSVSTARTNLGLGTAATAATTAFLQPGNNLSDVTTPATARTNLGLGTMATLNDASTKLAAGTNVTLSTTSNVTTINASLAGGTVSSAAVSSVNGEMVLFSGTGGSTITNSSTVPSANGLTLITHTFSTMRTDLGLGTSATVNTGTSGATIPLLNAANTWATTQTLTVAPVFTDASGTRTALGLGTSATVATGTSGATIPLLNGTNTWANAQTFTTAPVFTNQSGSRTALGLGTASTANTGTSGTNVPLLDGTNTWANTQTFTVAPVFTATSATRTALGLTIGTNVEPYGAYNAQNNQAGTTYTLVLGDQGKLVTMSNASANTLTVPLNASVAFPVLTRIEIVSLAAGQTAIAATGGVTINSSGSKLKLTGQYSGATLIKTATDTWLLIGDIAT